MMKRFKVIYYDDNDSKQYKIIHGWDGPHAIEKCKAYLMYNTVYQLGTITDCIELKPLKRGLSL